jgi:hypothetical protein
LDVHYVASGSVFRNNTVRRRHVSSPKRSAPLAPMFVNWSLTFLVIT